MWVERKRRMRHESPNKNLWLRSSKEYPWHFEKYTSWEADFISVFTSLHSEMLLVGDIFSPVAPVALKCFNVSRQGTRETSHMFHSGQRHFDTYDTHSQAITTLMVQTAHQPITWWQLEAFRHTDVVKASEREESGFKALWMFDVLVQIEGKH